MSRHKKGHSVWGWFLAMLAVLTLPTLAETLRSPVAEPAKAAQRPAVGRAMRVLFIGNSYTYYNGGLGAIVQSLAAKGGHKLDFMEVTRGGQSLEGHWNDGKALAAIKKGGWDYVVLQEHSLRPIVDPVKMAQYVKLFDAEIKKVGARTLLYETWARKNKPETQATLCKSYETIAKEINAIVAPAGRAWAASLSLTPDLKLHVGDWSHPTPAGSYLNACVMYATIFGQSPEGLPHVIRSAAGKALFELAEPDANLLQRATREMLVGWWKSPEVVAPAARVDPALAPAERPSTAAPDAAKRS